MQKIIPHFWFDKEAKEATAFYVSLFNNSSINSLSTIKDTPSGDCDMVSFTLAGQSFMAISAGPIFKFNPSISLFTVFTNKAEIQATWDKLAAGGKVLMPFDTYPWAKKYGWLQDKYGLSWQLSWTDNDQTKQQITPMLMFTKAMAGKAKEALGEYTNIFPNSSTDMVIPYDQNEGDSPGHVKHSRFTLSGQSFMAMDSSGRNDFNFNEAISFVVHCDTQEEIDYFWGKLSSVPEAEQCGWLKDKYGVSWQIVPSMMNELMGSDDKEKITRVTKAFLQMKKFDIAALKAASLG